MFRGEIAPRRTWFHLQGRSSRGRRPDRADGKMGERRQFRGARGRYRTHL